MTKKSINVPRYVPNDKRPAGQEVQSEHAVTGSRWDETNRTGNPTPSQRLLTGCKSVTLDETPEAIYYSEDETERSLKPVKKRPRDGKRHKMAHTKRMSLYNVHDDV